MCRVASAVCQPLRDQRRAAELVCSATVLQYYASSAASLQTVGVPKAAQQQRAHSGVQPGCRAHGCCQTRWWRSATGDFRAAIIATAACGWSNSCWCAAGARCRQRSARACRAAACLAAVDCHLCCKPIKLGATGTSAAATTSSIGGHRRFCYCRGVTGPGARWQQQRQRWWQQQQQQWQRRSSASAATRAIAAGGAIAQ